MTSKAGDLLKGAQRIEPGKAKLIQTRTEVERGWRAVSDILVSEGQPELAAQVRRFIDQMPTPRTVKERQPSFSSEHAISESVINPLRGDGRRHKLVPWLFLLN